jgi:1,4-dihydroxy-2-naphthoate octaprenyltransferase
MRLKTVIQTTRPSFLILTPVCIFLGISITVDESLVRIDNYVSSLILIGAVFAHIAVNVLNEYYDFKSGLDLKTDRTPFSGGSGALPNNPGEANITFVVGLISLIITCVIGIYLAMTRGNFIVPIGITGLLLIVSYTNWLNRIPILCLLAPGFGFGVLMVVGTNVVLTGKYTELAFLISLVPFFLINNLLLLNQYPDINADSRVGRRTFPVVYGTKKSNAIYALFTLTAYSLILYYLYKGVIPLTGAFSLVPLVFSIYAFYGAVQHSTYIGNYSKYLGANVAASVLTPLLLAVAIING